MKGDKMAKRSSFGSMMRRRLSDITNSSPPQKSPGKLPLDNVSAKEFIDHLVKEKMALVKLLQEKKLSGIEIQKLRTCLQKMQLQNWTLAQTNTQLSAEINLGKDRLKALQHEVVCKEILLKTKNLQLKEKEKANVQKEVPEEPEVVTKEAENNEDTTKPSNASRRRRLSRSRSLGSSTIPQQQTEKEAAVSKRRCLRRQSTSSRTRHEEELRDDKLFEIDEAKFPDLASKRSTGEVMPLETERRRSSTSRPLRKAAEKVQSYKEIPINVKMRRY